MRENAATGGKPPAPQAVHAQQMRSCSSQNKKNTDHSTSDLPAKGNSWPACIELMLKVHVWRAQGVSRRRLFHDKINKPPVFVQAAITQKEILVPVHITGPM